MSDLTREGQSSPDPDLLLVRMAKEGNQDALQTLLEMHQDRIFRTALGLTGGNEDAATEIAQNVMISVFRHIQQFRGDSKFTTWVYRMTVNFAKNFLMAEGRHKARFVSMNSRDSRDSSSRASQQVALEAPRPSDLASGTEMIDILQQRIESLPEDFRSVLVLRYMEDLSYEEISNALELPLGTVKSRINRGRAELRHQMANILNEEGIWS